MYTAVIAGMLFEKLLISIFLTAHTIKSDDKG